MKIDIKNLKKIINKFKGKKVLVIGDIMLDHFIWGKVKRISPEAPVPVVEVVSESYMPGGAANVAMNLNALGISTDIIGVFGNDSNGELLQKQLKKSKVNTKGMVKSSSASTTKKSRIIAHNQQVVRVDRDSKNLTSDDEDLIIARVKKMVPLFDGVIVEDYGKGVISQHVFDEIIKVAKQNNIFTSFDPKMGHDILCAGIDLCTPNLEEARYLNKISSPNMPLDLPKQGEQLRENLGINNLLITLGEDGMGLFTGREPFFIPTKAREVFDVSGAGDTVISVYTASIAAGASQFEAAYLSNIAGGIVIGKIGTATVTPKEIADYLDEEK